MSQLTVKSPFLRFVYFQTTARRGGGILSNRPRSWLKVITMLLHTNRTRPPCSLQQASNWPRCRGCSRALGIAHRAVYFPFVSSLLPLSSTPLAWRILPFYSVTSSGFHALGFPVDIRRHWKIRLATPTEFRHENLFPSFSTRDTFEL